MDRFGNVNGSERGIELEVQFVFTSCLTIIQAGMLFSIAVKEFNLEATVVVSQYLIGVYFNIGTEVEFGGTFSAVFRICNMNQDDIPF
jgi:hypothetical protein